MTSIAGRKSLIAGLALFLALTGCDQSDTPSSTVPKYATQTPALLRTIPISNLSVQVSIDNVTKTFQGSDFPDGQWLIDFDLQPNQTYDILIKWFALTHLILEETGPIFTDPEQQTITPLLDFVSASYDRFDSDCDGQSNLDEIISGTSLTAVAGATQSGCEGPETTLMENEFPWIVKQHSNFPSAGITSRVTSYSQSIQITSSNPTFSTNFGASLYTGPDADVDVRTRLDFRVDAQQIKQIRFLITPATDFQISAIAGARCLVQNEIGIACTIPYEWQEQQWYTFSIEEQSTKSWKAMVREGTSGVSLDIGTIESEPNINWYRGQNGLSHSKSVSSDQCRLGIAPIGMRYKQAVTNNIQVLGSRKIVPSNCVKTGAGWSEGIRTIDDELLYSLTLGRSE